MCGICGFLQLTPEADKAVLRRMNDRLHHRGPDDEGYFFEKKVGLAARRLSIIDLVTGHQPLQSSNQKCWITYNGEVYNFHELRKELESKGCRFKTQTDTEVIVNLYEYEGLEFVKKLRGMFALGIYDKRLDRFILARDHLGIKPLYYCVKPGNRNLVFGSEIKAILQYPGIPRELDHEALDFFFTLEYIPAPLSIFKGIRKLPPGHLLVYEKGELNISQYWDVAQTVRNRIDGAKKTPPLEELKEEFHEILTEAVKIRLISDVPLGAFLSGGIDSSAIVASMAGLSDQRVKTFSIGFEEKSYSELKYSEAVAAQFDTDHYTRNLSPDINELVTALADYMCEPLGDFSNFPTYLVSKTAREKVTVVLSGDGGDEIFGGYEHYIAQKIARPLDFPPFRPLHRLMAKMTHLFPPSELKKGFVNRIKRFSEGLDNPYINRHFRWMLFLSGIQKKHLYSSYFKERTFLNNLPSRPPFDRFFESAERFDGINRDLYLDLKSYMVDNILV